MTPRSAIGTARTPHAARAARTRAGDGGDRSAVAHAIARLSAEFPTRRDAVVSATVLQCRNDLDDAPPGALPELLERSARQRLRDGAA